MTNGIRRAGWPIILLTSAVALPAAAQTVSAPVAEATNPVAQALRDRAGGKFRDVYRARGYWPLWVAGDRIGPQATALIDVIDSAGLDGLDSDRYGAARLQRLIEAVPAGDARALADAELAFSAAFVDLVRDMRDAPADIDYVDPSLKPKRMSPADALRRAALAPSLADYVRRLGWMSPLYAELRSALAAAEDNVGDVEVTVPGGAMLRPGDVDYRVALLRVRMGLPDGDEYDAALATRVRAFQAARGLPADGIVGARTIAALNRAASGPDRRALLQRNLERARLLPDAWTRHIVVDAASARLTYFDGGVAQGTMRVVVGTPQTPTPMMAGVIRYATLNPYWNVPVDLVRKRIAPAMLKGKSLRAMGYEALSGFTADAGVIDATTIDWRGVAAGSVEPRVRELPGRGNSMGSVKFQFPNEEGIYLHDTPQRALFAKPDRHFSNGCVRLEDAKRLGRWLFGRDLAAEGAAPEQHVALADPVPVYLTYLTASPGDDGVRYVADAYGRDSGAGEEEEVASR